MAPTSSTHRANHKTGRKRLWEGLRTGDIQGMAVYRGSKGRAVASKHRMVGLSFARLLRFARVKTSNNMTFLRRSSSAIGALFDDTAGTRRSWLLIVLTVLALLAALASYFVHVNFPLGITTSSRALYVDEGFYSDAAQNFVKFGTWHLPHDIRFWPGASFVTAIQSVAFSIFGATVTTARSISVFFSVVSGLSLYLIARTRFSPALAGMLTLTGVTSVSFVTYARSAIADPVALAMSLVSILVFVRIDNRSIAIPLSIVLAFLAFLSKIYFLFAVATMVAMWVGEVFLKPYLYKEDVNKQLAGVLVASVLGVASLYYLYGLVFHEAISSYMSTNVNKTPSLNTTYLVSQLGRALFVLPLHTNTKVLLFVLLISIVYFFVAPRLPGVSCKDYLNVFRRLSRADWAMGTFLVLGFLTITSLRLHKPHYFYFSILPIAFLAISSLCYYVPTRLRDIASLVVLLLHLWTQLPSYKHWVDRPDNTSVSDASRAIIKRIQLEESSNAIPVIGEYASQLGLYSSRILPLDAKWLTQERLCASLSHWRPTYHVNIVWPRSISTKELGRISECPEISGYEEVARYTAFSSHRDEIVLSRLRYKSG